MEHRNLLPHYRFQQRPGLTDLSHHGLLADLTASDYATGFGVGHFPGALYQSNTYTAADSLIGFQPNHLVNGIAVASTAVCVVCPIITHYTQLRYHLTYIATPFHNQARLLPPSFICQQFSILLFVTSRQKPANRFANPLGEVYLCQIQTYFIFFKEFFYLALELCDLSCYNIFHREQLSFA
jgi:hypothetical protein